ncbi:MAG: S41 family peptidase [Sphingobacteriales bacterium]
MPGNVFAQNAVAPLPQLPAEKLRQDLMTLKDSLEKLHPGIYRYQTKATLDNVFDQCYHDMDHTMTVVECFKYIDYLIGQIEDGHTECFLPSEVNQWLKANAQLFPMGLWLSGDHAYVLCNTVDFPAGTEILAINGRPIPKIIHSMLGELSSDGANLTGKYDKINRGHDPFPYLYFVLNGSQENFSLAYKNPDGNPGTKIVSARKFNELECMPSTPQPAKFLSLEYKPHGIAVMTIRTLLNELLDRTRENFGDFLLNSFKDIDEKHITKLIIDLRENGGGDDTNGSLLYSYLADKPFRYYERLDKTNGPYTQHPNLALQQLNTEHYKGKVFFLTNGGTFSSTAEFAAIAKSNHRGLFIGQETGGGYYGNTSGDRTTIYLPNTKIRVNIPLTKYTLAVKPLKHGGRGVIPDLEIASTINDKISGRDSQMEAALKIAKKRR